MDLEVFFYLPLPLKEKHITQKNWTFFPQNPIFHDQKIFLHKTFWS